MQKEGKDIVIGFNPKFLIDALDVSLMMKNVNIYLGKSQGSMLYQG